MDGKLKKGAFRMFPRIITPSPTGEGDRISALVEPREGHSDEEIANALESGGAVVRQLAPGVMSVKASRSSLEQVKNIARVSVRQQNVLR
jgi:hypothetical protein